MKPPRFGAERKGAKVEKTSSHCLLGIFPSEDEDRTHHSVTINETPGNEGILR